MEEKEERILITKCSSWCHARRMSCDPFDDKDGMYCDKSGKWVRITEKECAKCKDPVLLGISRQEAIDRIAKSLCQSEGWPCKECRYGKDNVSCQTCLEVELYKQYAESALNALLGESND